MTGISEKYHAEVKAVLARMAEKLRTGEKTPAEFMAAQARLLTAYRLASK